MSAPRHFNPRPRFGLRVPTCRECGMDLDNSDNPVVHLGGGVFVKFGLCVFCLSDELDQRGCLEINL